nr:SDR family oxidoreductase [Polymorphobacter sp.]
MVNSKGTALVTGASAGIGAIYANRLAQRGYNLILVARSRDRLDSIAARITDETGRSVEVVEADLGDKADLHRVEALLKSDASITVLVNNAGIGAPVPTWQADVDLMEQMIDVNVTALMRLSYAAAPGFVTRGQGTIINIASVVAIAPEFLLNGVYGAGKAFVIALTESLRRELADKGVRVQAVLPGATATDFWDLSGVPLSGVPAEITMRADDMVDAALAGLDLGETVTIPALPELADWAAYEAARAALVPNLSRAAPANRYSHVAFG